MKALIFLAFLSTLVACDPFRLGYKENPAYVLDTAVKAILRMDQVALRDVLGKEAFCIYGTDEGMQFLKDQISVSPNDIKLNLKEISNTHHGVPRFVGYWSYLTIRYGVEIRTKTSPEVLLETIVDCDFGIEGEKDPKWVNKKYSKYKKKECKAVKLIPKKLAALPMPAGCQNLMVEL